MEQTEHECVSRHVSVVETNQQDILKPAKEKSSVVWRG